MLVSQEQLKKYACGLQRQFFIDFENEYDRVPTKTEDMTTGITLYNSNEILEYLVDYGKVPDISKEYFFFMCMNIFGDVPEFIQDRYTAQLGLKNCGTSIYNSYACTNCNVLVDCNLLYDSFGCIRCKFSDHLIYCTEQRHESYMAFNKYITKKRYKELSKLSPEQLKEVPEYNEEIFKLVNDKISFLFRLK